MTPKVKIYSKPDCKYCEAAKSYLKKKGIQYEDYDVTADARARVEWGELSPRQIIPVIVVNGKTIIGFNPLNQLSLDRALESAEGR